jgi:hypothetical protein
VVGRRIFPHQLVGIIRTWHRSNTRCLTWVWHGPSIWSWPMHWWVWNLILWWMILGLVIRRDGFTICIRHQIRACHQREGHICHRAVDHICRHKVVGRRIFPHQLVGIIHHQQNLHPCLISHL